MNSNSRMPTIRTEDLTPQSTTPVGQSLTTPAVPPSSPSIPRLPSQTFDSPSLDISISSLLAGSNTLEPKVDTVKLNQLAKEKSELDERLKQIEQRLKAVEEAEKKRGAGTTA
ncbi:hypothetical protein FRC07_006406 [Ceratobasidium sp. 392]|nr:hypothetical protein FRC07_006406 [Ceratobasidium sp. 392]